MKDIILNKLAEMVKPVKTKKPSKKDIEDHGNEILRREAQREPDDRDAEVDQMANDYGYGKKEEAIDLPKNTVFGKAARKMAAETLRHHKKRLQKPGPLIKDPENNPGAVAKELKLFSKDTWKQRDESTSLRDRLLVALAEGILTKMAGQAEKNIKSGAQWAGKKAKQGLASLGKKAAYGAGKLVKKGINAVKQGPTHTVGESINLRDRILDILVESLDPHPESRGSQKRATAKDKRQQAIKARENEPSKEGGGVTKGDENRASSMHAPVTAKDRAAGKRPVRKGSNEYKERQKQAGKDNERHKRDMAGLEANYKSSAMPKK